MSAAVRILERLEKIKQTGAGRWIALCPAHDDRSPSLSIRELPDGRLLLHCFGECPTQLVLQAIGLDFADLFDNPLAQHLPPVQGGLTARELLELNAHEAMVAALLVGQALEGKYTTDDVKRLELAAARLAKAQRLVTHGY